MAEVITYNGIDITEEASASRITHEMYAGGHPDTLDIMFEDDDHLWPRWKPQIGDTISYENGGAATGTMYIYDMEITEDETRLYANSLPRSLRTRYVKAWEEVYLSQMLKELTGSYQIMGMDDVWYKYRLCDTRISGFINTTAELESAVFVCHDGKAMIIGEQALEAQDEVIEIDSAGCSIAVRDRRSELYDACVVQSGDHTGVCRVGSGERIYKPNVNIPCTSDAEATRFAKGLLRMANKQMYDIRLQGSIIPQLTAGICVNFTNDDMPDHQGKMFLHRVRHEYHRELTTVYMRKPLEGY